MRIDSKVICAAALVISVHLGVLAADTISGTVRNRTDGRASAGDEVVLLRSSEGMQEEERSKTDGNGAFSFKTNNTGQQHIVRVIHQGVSYDQPVISSSPVELAVYDVVRRISSLSGNMGIVQIEADEREFRVAEMYAISNDSKPPVSQLSPHDFSFNLPSAAVLDSVEGKNADGAWVQLSPVPEKPEGGRYAIQFPLRPGETLFRLKYHVVNRGPRLFHIELAYPIRNLAVIHPPTMSFKALHSDDFKHPGLVKGFQLEVASKPLQYAVPAFEISGTGQDQATPQAKSGLVPPISPPQPNAANTNDLTHNGAQSSPTLSGKENWALAVSVLLMIIAETLIIWRRKRKKVIGNHSSQNVRLTEILQDEISQLERDRLQGLISDDQYASTKDAIHYALRRASSKSTSSDPSDPKC